MRFRARFIWMVQLIPISFHAASQKIREPPATAKNLLNRQVLTPDAGFNGSRMVR